MIRLILIVIFAIIIFFASLIMLPVFWLIGKFNQDAKDRGSLRFVQGFIVADGTVLVLDRVADPGNVGTLIRTAEAAGIAAVVLLAGCADAYAPKTVRSTMGSLLRMPVLCDMPEDEFISWAHKNNYEIMVTCLDGAQNLYEAEFGARTAIVVGSEAYGASESLKVVAAKRVFIPMQGRAESLNAAVAGGIVMFEAMRRRLAT